MKTCTKCGEAKPLSEFPFRRAARDQRQTRCFICQRTLTKKHYEENREYYKEKAKRATRKSRQKYKDLKSSTPCADCGVTYPYYVMDFDHTDPSVKIAHVSDLMGYGSIRAAAKEMEKCELVCANCHRERTHQRRLNMPT